MRFYHSFFKFLSTPSARRATGGNFPRKSPTKNFYPRPPRGGRPVVHGGTVPAGSVVYPRPPRGGRLDLLQSSLHEIMISIHALREEGDLGLRYEGDNAKVFLSTPSARRATLVYGRQRRGKLISIHALREEGDTCLPACAPFTPSNFYPRPPRGGRLLLSVRQHFKFCISIHALREEGDPR